MSDSNVGGCGQAGATTSTAPRTLIYQIFVDRFAKSDGTQVAEPGGETPWHAHSGGTLDGITARLNDIQALGADAVYITPIFRAKSNHKYDPSTFEEVDPRFGGNEAFDRLAAECKRRGIGLILDGVFNHIGTEHEWFQRASAGEHAPERSFFNWNCNPREYSCWQGHPSLPELNLENARVREYLFEEDDSVVRRWLRRGATGWRLDCANDLGRNVCSNISRAVREEGAPDGTVGEVMTYGEEWLNDSCLDGVMNYYFRETVLALVREESPVAQAAYNLKRMARNFHYPGLLRSWNLLSSHDTPRLATLVPDPARRALAFTLAFTVPGTPMLYYGEAIGMHGGADPANRGPMIWDSAKWDTQTQNHIRSLAQVRANAPALRTGQYLPMPQPGNNAVLAFARTTSHPSETVLVVANASDETVKTRIFVPYSYLFDGLPLDDLLNCAPASKVSAGTFNVELPPWAVALYSPRANAIPRYQFFKDRVFGADKK